MSKMIGELILDHDRVALPGVGTFVAVDMPASFSDRGYTINPPYRKLSFTADKADDSLLAELYASGNGISVDQARAIITRYLCEVAEVLKDRKTIVFEGLGRLRATKNNTFFFVCDEDLDIYPDGFGLQPVSLKTHLTPDPEPQLATEPLTEPQPATEPLPEPIEAELADVQFATEPESQPGSASELETLPEPEIAPAAENESAPVPEQQPQARGRRRCVFGRILLWIVILAAVSAAAIYLLGHYAPSVLDNILYTPEELEIINYDA